jgi:hypothetical protein
MMSENRTGVWTLHGSAMRIKLVASYLIREFFAFGIEIKRYPTDVVLGGVRVRDFFAYGDLDFEKFVSLDCVCAFDDWRVFLHFPVCFLN